MNFNWNQSGMPVSLVSGVGQRSEFSAYRSVLKDAQDLVLLSMDADAMARELVQSGGREYVEIVRELSDSLAKTRKELELANRRCERLVAELERRGISFDESTTPVTVTEAPGRAMATGPRPCKSEAEGRAEWEEWNRRFEALLG